MTAKLNVFTARQFLDGNGDPYSAAQLFVYEAGSSTKATVTKDLAGLSDHANPIILNSKGEAADGSGATQAIWQENGSTLKFVLAPSTDTDPPIAAISTWDNLVGINDTSETTTQWVGGTTPIYVSATSFTLVGDQTTELHVGRRLKSTNTGGTVYSTIITSTYTSLTTITVVNDSGVLDSGLSTVFYGIITAANSSISSSSIVPLAGADIASATTIDLSTATGNSPRITGTTATSAVTMNTGQWSLVVADGAWPLTYHATNNKLNGGIDYTCAAGDRVLYNKDLSGVVHGIIIRADGKPVIGDLVLGAPIATTSGTSHDFTGIPSWVKKITFMLTGVSTNGVSGYILQIGDAGGIEATAYASTRTTLSAASSATGSSTDGARLVENAVAASTYSGEVTLSLENASLNSWVLKSHAGVNGGTEATISITDKSLSATLDRIRLTTVVGTDTFDAGSVNVLYE